MAPHCRRSHAPSRAVGSGGRSAPPSFSPERPSSRSFSDRPSWSALPIKRWRLVTLGCVLQSKENAGALQGPAAPCSRWCTSQVGCQCLFPRASFHVQRKLVMVPGVPLLTTSPAGSGCAAGCATFVTFDLSRAPVVERKVKPDELCLHARQASAYTRLLKDKEMLEPYRVWSGGAVWGWSGLLPVPLREHSTTHARVLTSGQKVVQHEQ